MRPRISFKYGTVNDDVLILKADQTVAYGDDGNDTFIDAAPVSDDLMFGERGNDTLYSSDGNDDLFGGKGDDVFVVEFRDSDITVNGEGGDDTIHLINRSGADLTVLEDGNRTVVTGDNGFHLVLRNIDHVDWGN